MKMFRKKSDEIGPIDWHHLDFYQDFDDLIFVEQNHDQMYVSFDEVGEDILHFFRFGSFRKEARREWFEWEPFD